MKLQVRIGTFIGNILHHYDTSIFGWVAPFLAPILFPEKSGTDALLLTFAFLPLAYLAKPIGALFWGLLGDRFGRKPVLVATLFGMALSTAAIGCLPISATAWMWLALFRVFQGFFSAGEETGAALFLLEHASKEKRDFTSALYDATGIAGIFAASMLTSFLGNTHWRVLFWIGSIAGFSAMFLRSVAQEPKEYAPSKISLKALWENRIPFIQITLVSGFSYANYFLLSVFLNGFLPQISTLTKEDMLTFNTHLLWIDSLLLLGFGYLCTYIKKETIMASAAFFAALSAIPLFACLENCSWTQAALIRLTLVIFGVALAAPFHAWKLDILPNHRFLIGGVGSALGAKLFGAPIPLISTWLVSKTGEVWTAALPIVILGLSSSIVIFLQLRSRVKTTTNTTTTANI